MSMRMLLIYALTLVSGFLLGFLYFRFLWMTVRRLALSLHPVRLLIISFVVRLGLVLGAFYLLMDGEAGRLLLVLGGFVAARELCKRLWGERGEHRRIQAAVGGYQ
jgi:F1F0 ATPase subunit 2